MQVTKKSARLLELEAVIAKSAQAVWDMAEALREIKDGALYRETHDNWESYLRERWGISTTWAHHVINAVETRALLEAKTLTRVNPPTTVSQARHLNAVPDQDKPKVWEDAVATARIQNKEEPSKRDVEAAVRRYQAGADTPQDPPHSDAVRAANRLSVAVDNTIQCARNAFDVLDRMPEEEREAVALRVVHLVTTLMHEMEQRGLVQSQVVRGAMHFDEEVAGRVEVMA